MAKPYIIPFVVYLVSTMLASRVDEGYPIAYGLVVLVCTVTLFYLLRGTDIVRLHWRVAPGIAVGLLGILLWIVISHFRIESLLTSWLPGWLQPAERVSYNPFLEIDSTWSAWAFVFVRIVGLSLIVPLAEELFWRGFLMRWLIDQEWNKVPLGTFSWESMLGVTLLFTLAHPEWIAAAIYCLLLNLLMVWKKDLWLCIVAHGTSNLVLAIYILRTESWWLW